MKYYNDSASQVMTQSINTTGRSKSDKIMPPSVLLTKNDFFISLGYTFIRISRLLQPQEHHSR